MSFRRNALAVLFSTLTFASIASAALKPDGKGTFTATGSATVKVVKTKIGPFSGTGPLTGKAEGDKYVFTADLQNLDMGERTEHTREGFKFKGEKEKGKRTVTLEVPKAGLNVPSKQGEKTNGKAPGKIFYRGESAKVTVNYKTEHKGAEGVLVDANFSFDYMADLKLEQICKMGAACVDPKVTITVKGLKFVEE